jgi:hypothetical protein
MQERAPVGEVREGAVEGEPSPSRSAIRRVRNRRRNSLPSTLTARGNAGREDIQRVPSRAMPPPGTIIWICGWWVSADLHVCSTAVMPMRAPRCLGSAAIVSIVSDAALNSRS